MLKELWRKIVKSWNHLELIELQLEWWKKYESCSRIWNKDAVAWILRHIQNNTYILIEQYRYPVKQKVLELVSWLIDKTELTNKQILSEEIYEETGYKEIKKIDFLSKVSASAGKSNEKTFLYDVEISWNRYSQKLGDMEDIKVCEVEYNNFEKFLASKIKSWLLIDPKVCMAIYITLNKI